MNSYTVLWETVIKKLEIYYTKSGNNFQFEQYIRHLSPEFEENGVYYFKVPNSYYKEQIEARFENKITETLCEENAFSTGIRKDVSVKILTPEEFDRELIRNQESSSNASSARNYGSITLRPTFTFENFVVGSSNELAHAASLAVANAPGFAYNPLFIYGGVGLGKTHLMHAIGNRILENNPNANIIYITTESFTNEYIDSIQKHTTEAFRNKFRSADVLMIDDIQFISKAERTQEELFHTFNTLYESDRQIVFSSDKPPAEIPKMEERLLSRFNSGLLTDIRLPDYETRVAILRNKSSFIKQILGFNFDIDDEVFHYIASREESNIRDLEGALKRLIANAKLNHISSNITMEMAEVALKDFFKGPAVKAITPSLVIRTVCDYYDISEDDVRSSRRNKEIAFPRQIIMYVLKELTDFSNQKISESVGRGDHTTAIYAYDKIKSSMETDSVLKAQIGDILMRIKE